MPYDRTLDTFVESLGEYFGEELTADTSKRKIAVEVWAYKGEPRVEVSRQAKTKGQWQDRRLGRLSAEEALAVAKILTDNTDKLSVLRDADDQRDLEAKRVASEKRKAKFAARAEKKRASEANGAATHV